MNDSTPYDFTQLLPWDFADSNCFNVTMIWSYLQFNTIGGSKYYWGYGFDESVYESIIQGFEAVKNGTLERPAMNEDFWDWAFYNGSVTYAIMDIAWNNCSDQMCKDFGWEGSPDIAGVGVSTMFSILTPRPPHANRRRCWPHT